MISSPRNDAMMSNDESTPPPTLQSNPDAPPGLLVCDDFFFSTRIVDTARALGRKMLLVSNADAIRERMLQTASPLLIIDLNCGRDLLAAVPTLRAEFPELHMLAFGSHVETELLKLARQAGCQVMPRSQFTTELATVLEQRLPAQ